MYSAYFCLPTMENIIWFMVVQLHITHWQHSWFILSTKNQHSCQLTFFLYRWLVDEIRESAPKVGLLLHVFPFCFNLCFHTFILIGHIRKHLIGMDMFWLVYRVSCSYIFMLLVCACPWFPHYFFGQST